MTCLRRILGVTKIRNANIKESLSLDQDVLNRLEQKRLKYFGHINRIQNTRYPKKTMEGNVRGHRLRGYPLKGWLDCISHYCKTRSITSLTDASRLATDMQIHRTEAITRIPLRPYKQKNRNYGYIFFFLWIYVD